MNKRFSAEYFRSNMPEWKRKKDPILCRIFYRPLSFVCSSICANLGINANTVSYFSGWLAVIGCICFLPDNIWLHLTGAILFNVWLLLDCTDGNLARSYKRQPFGDFSDAISSYMLVGFMGAAMGVACYFEGGALFDAGSPWIIFIGAMAGSFDTMMRLIYQKYLANERAMVDKGVMPKDEDKRTDHSQVGSFRVRMELELGIAGFLPVLTIFAVLYHFLDLIVIYCFLYYGLSFLVSYFMFVRKAILKARQYGDKMVEI